MREGETMQAVMRSLAALTFQVMHRLMVFAIQLLRWWWRTFRMQSPRGRIWFAGGTLLVLCCLCSIPSGLITPSRTPSPAPAPVGLRFSTPTFTTMLSPPFTPSPTVWTTNMPIPTATLTLTPSPSPKPTRTATATRTPTPSRTPRPTATPTPEIRSDALRTIPGAECLPPDRPVESAHLVRVIDGDTIDVALGGQTRRVRYIGIDAPERNQPFYAESAAANRSLVAGKTLWLVRDVSETDRYGRLLRYVIAGEIFVNLALVREGYAQTMTVPPDVSCAEAFRAAEAEARAAGRGLWGWPTPTPTALLPTAAPPPPAGNCHPAYPTVCIPPPPPDLDCGDIPYRNFPVDHRYGDPHRFDGDRDGIGCER